MATICVDVGTSVIKTVAFDDRGSEIALARQETEVLRPASGFSEQDMYSVWDAAVAGWWMPTVILPVLPFCGMTPAPQRL
jgi:sugar (pentulose or hexulose) kinase